MEDAPSNSNVSMGDWLLACAVAVGLAIGVWWGLITGGGLVGGDIYSYFLPQKIVLSEAFAAGEVPLWHSLTGLGYPMLAESQAGVFYLPNQILYRLFDVNTAYNWGVVTHYCLAFIFAWRFARCQRLKNSGALLAALVFVYGWFPARISHEWSIVGGLWFPLTLWLLDRLLERPSRRTFVLLCLCLATHLLAGHFTLAFINQLTLVAYAFLKCWASKSESRNWKRIGIPIGAIALGMGCASVQMLPTYELKLSSQRHGDAKKFDPAFGHMPPAYATQLFASWWYWHTPELLRSKAMTRTPGAVDADSNHVEAHLYWGLIPFVFVVLSATVFRRRLDSLTLKIWGILIVASVAYATGWLMPVARHLPGFGFFNGPGRYTIIAALGGGIMAGMVLDHLVRNSNRWLSGLIVVALGGVTHCDLMTSSRFVADSIVIAEPPITKMNSSWIRKALCRNSPHTKRLLAPGPNVGNLFGVSCVPQYLGLGPAVYYDESLLPATGPQSDAGVFPSPENAMRWQQLGITHLLTTEEVRFPSPAIQLVQQYPDTLLNSIWGRGMASCFLYKLVTEGERVAADSAGALTSYSIGSVTPNSFEFEVEMTKSATVTLKELMYPGWSVYVDGQPGNINTVEADAMFRSVEVAAGSHKVRWQFESKSFLLGIWFSGGFLCVAVGLIFWPSPKNTPTNVE